MEISIFDIGNIFTSVLITSKDTRKWIAPFDPAHQIGLSTFLEAVLIVVGGPSSLNLKNSKIRPDFLHIFTGRYGIVKQRAPFDPAHQVGLNMLVKEVLTVGEVSVDGDLKFVNWERFPLQPENQ